MKRFFLGLVIFTCLFLNINEANALEDPISVNGHRITKLTVESDPKLPKVGSSTKSFTVNFRLRSKTGISKTRLKVFVGSTAIVFNSNDITLKEIVNDNEDEDADDPSDPSVDTYDVTMTKTGLIFNKTDNEIKVQYLLSSITPSSVQAQRSVEFFASANGNGGGNSGGNGGNGGGNGGNGTGNGDDVSQTPQLVSIFVDEINGDGMVSTSPRRFLLTVDHDRRLIDAVTVINGDSFNEDTNPFLKNLKIIKINPDDKNNKKEQTDIRDDFNFSLEQGSVAISSGVTTKNGQVLLRTTYLSDERTIKERQNLKFVINLQKFYEKSGVVLESNLITRSSDTIKIKAQEIEVDSLQIEEPISFNLVSPSKKKLKYSSEQVNLTGSFSLTGNGTLTSSSDTIEFYSFNDNDKKITPKISGAKKIQLKPSIISSSGASFSNTGGSSYSLTIPLQINVSSTNSTLKQGAFFDSAVTKTLRVPFSITAKSTDGLDLIIRGDYNATTDLVFSAAE